MKKHPPKSEGSSQRQLRVGEVVRHALADIFSRGDVYDPYLAKLTLTVTEVRMSPDLKHAFAFVMPLGQPYSKELERALKNESPRLRTQVGQVIRLRYTPQLHFIEDKSFDEAEKINRILLSPKVSRDIKD